MNKYIFKTNFNEEISIEASNYDEARILLVIYLQQAGFIQDEVKVKEI